MLPRVVEAEVFGAGSGLDAVVPPKRPPEGAAGFRPPNNPPAVGCELVVVAAAVSAGLGVPKRPPEGLFRPPKRDGACVLPFPAGVPAGVVEDGKLKTLPAGLLGAGVVEPRENTPLVPAGLLVPPMALRPPAGVSGLFGVGNVLFVGVELLVF